MRFAPLILALLAPLPALAQDAWQALSAPGAVALMRHAEAPGTYDPEGFRLDDCATQRNLNQKGRDQARAIGKAMREHGIGFDRVLTSQWCRCRETAALLDVGPMRDEPALNSFRAPAADQPAQVAAIKRIVATAGGEKLLLVTHQMVISALTGEGTASGEVVVVRAEGDAVKVLGRLRM